MTVRILRRQKAAQDAEDIADHIAEDSLVAALRFLENVESTLKDLAAFPGAGSPFESAHPELANLRFRRVKESPNHVIFYVEHTNAIEVVRILHGARDLDAELRRT
ncbi:MAG TPA: type II toxin-antitoxin system RelE/ParE family toxin [Pirellulaceae bacterium]|nr:type II toxin-antitoxin system RelE/ParE family toxin [Pirellulaceae bacterium]